MTERYVLETQKKKKAHWYENVSRFTRIFKVKVGRLVSTELIFHSISSSWNSWKCLKRKRNKIITINVKEERKKFICLFQVIIFFLWEIIHIYCSYAMDDGEMDGWSEEDEWSQARRKTLCVHIQGLPTDTIGLFCDCISAFSFRLSTAFIWVWISRISPI